MNPVHDGPMAQSRVETVGAPEAYDPPHQPPRVAVWGAGAPLGPPPSNLHPLPCERDRLIGHRIARLLARGREEKIKALFDRINGVAGQQSGAWVSSFLAIDPHHEEERSLALAILVCLILRPAIRESRDAEEITRLFELEDSVRDILQQMWTNGEPVETYLQESEVGLLLEKLFTEGCTRLETSMQAVVHAESLARVQINAQIDQAYLLIKERLLLLQRTRKEAHDSLNAQIDALTQQIEECRRQLLLNVEAMERAGEKEVDLLRQLEAHLKECGQVLVRLL